MLVNLSRPVVFAAGTAAGLIAALFAGTLGSGPRAVAQSLPGSPVGRYQIVPYSTHNSYGAYVLDSQTGEVARIFEGGSPDSLGDAFKRTR